MQYHSIRLVLFSWLPADSSRWVQCFHISCYQILKITDELIWTVNFTDKDRYCVCTKFDLVVFLIGQSTEKFFLRLFRNRFVIYLAVNLEAKIRVWFYAWLLNAPACIWGSFKNQCPWNSNTWYTSWFPANSTLKSDFKDTRVKFFTKS